MFTLGVPEMAVIFVLALVLFGPKKLPELGRTIGKAMTEFRRASNDLKATFEREMHTLERENQSIKASTGTIAREIADYTSVPSEAMWNPLADVMKEEIPLDETPATETPAIEAGAIETVATETTPSGEASEAPAPVSASEVSGAESTVTAHAGSAPPAGHAHEETPTTT